MSAMLGFIETMTLRPEALTAESLVPLRTAGLSDAAIEEAIHVCAQFNIYTRMADSLAFDVPAQAAFDRSARMLLTRGYR